MLRWLLLVALLAGATYVFTSLPIGGRTLLERVRGGPVPVETADALPSAGRPKSGPGLHKGPASDGGEGKKPITPAADHLTDEDRAGLDKLIETKLGQEAQGGPGGP